MSAKGHRWPRCYCGWTWLKHCPFDEPGMDHPSSCDKYHHEFIEGAGVDKPVKVEVPG